jgi:alpha-D-ribose 1-methylphosphonate 5-triphosphate synthase subunit PhnG
MDVFSRYVVGWMVAHAEQAALAERLLAETTATQQTTAVWINPPESTQEATQ